MTDQPECLVHLLWSGLPPYCTAAVMVLLLYVLLGNVRMGAKARAHQAGRQDRHSTAIVSAVTIVPIAGFALVVETRLIGHPLGLPFRPPPWLLWPGPTTIIGWTGVALSSFGTLLRLSAVMTLRERYTRTLLVQDDQAIEQSGPYSLVRHPGYAGSLLCLNGIALASCSAAVLAASFAATFAAYAYRVRVEDAMLIDAFGEQYGAYRREVAGLLPFLF